MVELLRTNDPVLISWLRAILADVNIDAVVFDTHTSILEGSAAAIPRRVMVAEEDYAAALRTYENSRKSLENAP
ncbi:MAG: DUF2007 domain-containing protein [Rhodospirillales bacterium]|nr:DUF2007 domain-containing protein [Rhodospirillales bacterium]